ncbi:MAG: cation transporter [Elusimicrobia bacterium RIFOXYA2_FULL_50_26]|nr:MAG: cation transporter [Elusimicrobia bacterium RIFOXYA2_FULL_50_26]OGS23403.1 MAG: cation transporter [Elusimicrobia bacterium RIFOXYB2_FULL_50_12]
MVKKSNAARLSIISNTALILMKLVVGITTGSVSILSEAVHSLMDLFAAVIAFVSVNLADRPPDKSHPFGHEKIENISGVIETILIFTASILIIKEAVHKIMHPSTVSSIGVGCVVMLVSAVVNFFVSRRLYGVARREGSVALEADALHLKADVYTSLGVAAGLAVLWITGIHLLDPIIAILVALFILREAYGMMVSSFGPLIDTTLSDEEIETVKKVVGKYRDSLLDFHELRTRRSGHIRHIDLHLTAPRQMALSQFHDICDRIERDIEQNMKNAKVLIHGEPCDGNCNECSFIGRKTYCK